MRSSIQLFQSLILSKATSHREVHVKSFWYMRPTNICFLIFPILIYPCTIVQGIACQLLQSKYSAHSAHYLGVIFIDRERIALLESNSIFKLKIEMFQW